METNVSLMLAECSLSSFFIKVHSNLEEKLQAMVQTLETESLSKIKAVKEEAEMHQGEENQSLVQWLRELQEILCEAEDVLDEFKYKHLEKKVLKKQHAYLHFIYSYNTYALYKSKVEAVLERLDHIASKVDDFIQLLSSALDMINN
ncbi:hypothetical protein J5N97_027662 [Dioscorea zingiberensis]|uniref:Disease resistance N-terminal domain-containing protein n=1 Tax=Dioscorea zingiberensis TaxID=325984 RepID=A0A9D5BXI9_9LILI|nr:hypothetical protein J5N97_027662 [Dioscorea zingiberensis]